MTDDCRQHTPMYTPRVNLAGGERDVKETVNPRGLPSLPPLDIKRVARPSETRQSPSSVPGQGVLSPLTSGASTPSSTPGSGGPGSPYKAYRDRKSNRPRSNRHSELDQLEGEFRDLGMSSPVPATHPEGELGHDEEGSDAGSISPFPAITVQKCDDPSARLGVENDSGAVASPLSSTGELSADDYQRRDSEHLLTPTPPSHRRSLDNKYMTYTPNLQSSRSEGCLEYLGNIHQARDARNQRFLLDLDKAQSTQGIWISSMRRASGDISPLAAGPSSPQINSPEASPPCNSPLTPRKPARLLPLQYSKSKSKTA